MDWAAVGVAIGGATMLGSGFLYVIRSEQTKARSDHDAEIARLDGRMDTHEAGCAIRQAALAETLREIKEQGHRFEDKLDRLVGRP